MELNNISEERARSIEQLLNNRPRKSLEFKTPLEIESRNKIVALTT